MPEPVVDENGKKRPGSKMIVAAGAWAHLDNAAKTNFNNGFKPLVEAINNEQKTSGVRTEHIQERLKVWRRES